MTPAYVKKLSLNIQKTDYNTQKIDGSTLVSYEIVIAGFSVQNRLEKVRFFEETFLLADTSIEMVLRMPFLTFSDVDIRFVEKKLKWKRYSIVEALPITDKRKFVILALNENAETFVVHITAVLTPTMQVYLFCQVQIG